MTISDAEFMNAQHLMIAADKHHDTFEDEHAHNCRDYACPLPDKVEALLKKKKH